jgi:hypothetical protein
MKSSIVRWASLTALFALGCSDQLEPGSKVDSFRVLAEGADLPYARPGETVKLTSLAYDPAARPITWAWASCTNPSDSNLEGCLAKIAETGAPESAIFAMGEDAAAPELVIPGDVISSLPPQTRSMASVGVVSVACPGELGLGEGPGGLPFRCQDRDSGREMELDEFIVGIKRIGVRERDRNQNPVIERIQFDGVDWPLDEVKEVGFCDRDDFTYTSCPEAEKHDLAAILTGDSFEAGKDEHGEAFEEQVVVQYYATEGIFESESRIASEPKNGWVARKKASGQTLRLWFVARDSRGGVSWTERQVKVR